MSIAGELLKSFKQHAERIAISEGSRNITYNLLFQQSLKVAAYLRKCELRNSCIAIEAENIADHVIALLGVVISGNYYVSVNTENRAFLAESSLPVALSIVSVKTHNDHVLVDDIFNDVYRPAETDFNLEITVDNNLCAFFTSGSTGKSKVIIHQHKNILQDTLRQIKDNKVTQDDKLDLIFSLTFSASLACIFPAFLTGAELCAFDLKNEGLNQLANFWQQKAITFSTISVTSFQGICKIHTSLHHLTSLRFVSISAEPVKDTTISLFQSRFAANVTLQIAYASTETRTISEMKICNNGEPLIYPNSIGQPVDGKFVHIADPAGNYLPIGSAGEIIVQSQFIANSYYGQPKESEQSFIIKDGTVYYKTGDTGYINDDGYLFYEGRLNGENKFNGIKINFLDIEQQIEKIDGVLQVAVVVNKFDIGHPRLTCFFNTNDEESVTANTLKQQITDSLPNSHLPQVFIALPQLPLTHSGKIDRKKLEQINLKSYLERVIYPSQNILKYNYEQVIIDSFKNALALSDIDANTDFFDAGGDSMSSLICIAQIEADLSISLSNTALIVNSTPKKLGDYINLQNTGLRLIEKVALNEFVTGKRTLYFLNNNKNNCYAPFVTSPLSAEFNLIELFYDMYGSSSTFDYPQTILEQLAQEIAAQPNSVVVGYSFNGYMAHQLSCIVPQIASCILIETYDYFDYHNYTRPKNKKTRIASLYWHLFKNLDFGYPKYCLKERSKSRKLKHNGSDINKPRTLFIDKVNEFLSSLQYKTTLNSCIYFQGSRNDRDLGKSWRSKIGGEFHYQSMVCNHSDIIQKKAIPMARFIVKTIC